MTERRKSGRLGRSALWHAARGLAVFPVTPGGKVPALEDDWRELATTDPAQIERWWTEAAYNIGVAAGPSELLVIDLDQPKTAGEVAPAPWAEADVHSGRDVLHRLAAEAGQRLPKTWVVATASGGQHLYFRQPQGMKLGNSAGRLGWKIDTRGHGGYVVAAGSMIRGQRYRAEVIRPPAELPAWIVSALQTQPAAVGNPPSRRPVGGEYGMKALTAQLDKLLSSVEGRRNDDLNFAAYALGQVVAIGALSSDVVHGELLSAAARIGLPSREAERTIRSGFAAGVRNPYLRVS